MQESHRTERGQVLVFIVAGLVGLIAITALSIDGGNAYFDRRRAQNAADTAAMAAGLAKIRQPDGSPPLAWKDAGYSRATTNGFLQNGPKTTVVVYACTEAGAQCTLPAGAVPEEYVKVKITSIVDTYFAPLVGIKTVTNQVDAIAKAKPMEPTTWYNGNALVATMTGCKVPGWPDDPFTAGGNSNTNITGSGIFVNSNCSDAYDQFGSSQVDTTKGTCVVGGASSTNTNPPPNHDCNQIDPSTYVLPNPVCDQQGKITSLGGGNYYATYGTYNDTFPSVNGPKGTLKLQKGLYCLNNGLNLGSQWNITTDTNGNHQYDTSEGVMFFIPHGGVTFNGGSNIELHAITCKQCGLDDGLVGYLIYLPPTNTETVKINGGSGSIFSGTILAPGSLITLEGGSSTGSPVNLWSQIIGYSVKLTGNSNLNIFYDKSLNATTWTNPQLQPYK
jgi:hypothetical protein